MNKHGKKMIAPVIIAVFFIAYYLFIGYVFISGIVEAPLFAKVLFIAVPLCLAGVIVYVLIERINEIRSGEEDDISKY